MSTINRNQFSINGIVDTNDNVMSNINKLSTASGCWMTLDTNTGLWSVVINNVGTSTASFDNNNIIGSISLSSTGLDELYNAVEVYFPHKDLNDQKDYVRFEIPENQLFANEPKNSLQIDFDCINDPIHAGLIGARELKQSRVDKIIEFSTDYSNLGLKAGDIVDVTSEAHGFNKKLFRIVTIAETDAESGEIVLSITALEYSADVYNTNGLLRTVKTRDNGIISKRVNEVIESIDDIDFGAQMNRMLLANAGLSLLNKLFKRKLDELGNPTDEFEEPEEGPAAILNNAKTPVITDITAPSALCEGASGAVTVSHTCTSCFFDIPVDQYDYTITGISAADINIPLTGKVTVNPTNNGASGSLNFVTTAGNYSSEKTITVTIGPLSADILVRPVIQQSYSTTANPTSVTEGGSSTITVNTTGVPDGTVVPYAITGAGTGRVSSALTGNITINSNTATFSLTTVDDAIFTGDQSVTFTVNPGWQNNPCSIGSRDFTATVTILDNDPAPPAPIPDIVRQYISVPVVWRGTYDGTDEELKSVTVARFANLPVPFAGEASVALPVTVSVTKGNPSTIAVTSTVLIATEQQLGGTEIEVITVFDPVAPLGQITGTKVIVVGYY